MKSFIKVMMLVLVGTFAYTDASAQYVSGTDAVSILANELNLGTGLSASPNGSAYQFVEGVPSAPIMDQSEMQSFIMSKLVTFLKSNVGETVTGGVDYVEQKMNSRNLIVPANQTMYNVSKNNVLVLLQL